ncbi:MAG: hypothetical protein ABSA12_00235 [Verrucomicrobiia bacterium]
MQYELNRSDWEAILEQILAVTAAHRNTVGYDSFKDLANERFFHHKFSCLLWKHFKEDGVDMWTEHLLTPEGKTAGKFSWKALRLENVQKERQEVLRGQRGNHDFVIHTCPRIRVEWKGPWMPNKMEFAQVCLKLLDKTAPEEPKLICAILAGAKKGNQRHLQAPETNLRAALRFACDVVGCDDIAKQNLFVYIATILDTVPRKFHWGQLRSVDAGWETV